MIISKIMAGLGNQMFQFAAGRRAAIKNNTDLKLDISWFTDDSKDTKRLYDLDSFNVDVKIATNEEINSLKGKRGSFVERVFYTRIPGLPQISKSYFFEKSSLEYYPKLLDVKNNTYLEGFWNYVRYFEDIGDVIKKDFTLKKPLRRVKNEILKEINKNKNSISLHVRRGDFVKNNNYANYFNILTPKYFEEAVKIILKKVKDPTVFVFSEDTNWAKENIKLGEKVIFVDPNDGGKSHEDMFLMSKCSHNIISNSTLSWWGAWLNLNPQKIVVAPKKWFKTDDVVMDGRMPEDWIQI